MAALSSHAAAAKEIRIVLKEKFPMVKFGDSVSVKWADGPIYDDVKAIVEDYQEGHFDSMTDMYDLKRYQVIYRELSNVAL